VPEPVAEEAPALEESATAAIVEGGAEAVVSEVEAEAVEAPAVETVETPAIVEEPQLKKRALKNYSSWNLCTAKKKPANLYRKTKTALTRNRTRRAKARRKRVILWSTTLIRKKKSFVYKHKKDGDWTEDW
jgi:hypothetical protein